MCPGWSPTASSLSPDGPLSSIQSFVACAVEANLAWNLTGEEHLTLYYDSVEELGEAGMFSVFFFSSLSGGQSRIVCVAFTLSYERKIKK